MHFHGTTTNQTEEDTFTYVMGCSAEESGVIFQQEANGLLGLKDRRNVPLDKMPLSKSFSLCLSDGHSTGGLIFGDWWTNTTLLSNYKIAWLEEPVH